MLANCAWCKQNIREFIESWNHHSLSTEHAMTPEQLFTIGMLDHLRLRKVQNMCDFNSIDLENNMEDTSVVDVPRTPDSVCPNVSTILGTVSSQV